MDNRNLVRAWELGHGRSASFRALLLLALVFPEKTRQELAQESLGRRNAALFRLREMLFGPQMQAMATCPECQLAVEFAVSTQVLCTAAPALPARAAEPWRNGEFELEVRPPTSLDLAPEEDEPVRMRPELARRCIVQARRGGMAIETEDVPEEVLAGLAENMTAYDPHVETRLNLDCPACGTNWTARFDVVSFLWAEIAAEARRLCGEVHALAAAYGWREPDILAMSQVRRELYLELV